MSRYSSGRTEKLEMRKRVWYSLDYIEYLNVKIAYLFLLPFTVIATYILFVITYLEFKFSHYVGMKGVL